MKDINIKQISQKEKPKKVVNIAENFLTFNEQQKGIGIKVLIPKQILQRLPITQAQVEAGNSSENLLNKIRQIIDSLYQGKEVERQNERQKEDKMDTTFMNSKNGKTSDSHRLLRNLTDKIKLQKSDKYIALSDLSIYYKWKI